MTTSPQDDDAGTPDSGGGPAPTSAGGSKRPATKRPAAKRPAAKRPARKPAVEGEQSAGDGAAASARKPASPRKPAAKRPAAKRPAAQGGKPRAGTKTSAARNAAGRTAVPQPTPAPEPVEPQAAEPAPVDAAEEQPAAAPVEPAASPAEPDAARVEQDVAPAEPGAAEAEAPSEGEVEAPEEHPAAEPEPEPESEDAVPASDVSPAPDDAAPAPEGPQETTPAAAGDPAPDTEPAAAEEPVAEAESASAEESVPAAQPTPDAEAPTPDPEAPTAVLPAAGGEAAPADEAAPAEAASAETRPSETPPALVLRGVSRSYGGTTAVAGIDLTVPAGSFYGLVGPNGAGKTTTMSMIAGLLKPDRGEISVAGVDLARNPRAAKAMLGVLPDRLRTFDRLTGRQLLYYFGVLRGLKPSVVAQRTADLARAFDLTDALGRVVSDYSAGMTKKVMLAGAMIHSPRLLVLDEPFEAVDPVSSATILDILSAYVAHGGTVLLSSHGMDLIERVCTRVAVIVAGQLLAEGTVEEVRGELTLEQRFVELSGEVSSMEGLEWLHTFSD